MFAELTSLATTAGWMTSTALATRYARALNTDPLTGLGNRAALYRRARRARRGLVGLLLVDLDHFKAINDTHGHDFGNAVLANVGTQLAEAGGKRELPVRLHGDEFAVWLGRLDGSAAAERRAEDIAAALAEPFWVDGHRINALGSVGLAVAPASTPTTELLGQADAHMYAVKNNRRLSVLNPGRNRRTRDTNTPGGETA